MKIIVLRHGPAMPQVLGCFGGAADFPLSEDGVKAAQELAYSLEGTPIEKIYSSSFRRGMYVADTINAKKQCGVIPMDGLKERNSFGVLSGCKREECKDLFGYLLNELKDAPGDYYSKELLMGAEPVPEFDVRIEKALQYIAEDAQKNNFETVAAVTHRNVIRSIYKHILKSDKKIKEFDLFSKTILEYSDGKFSLYAREGVHEA